MPAIRPSLICACTGCQTSICNIVKMRGIGLHPNLDNVAPGTLTSFISCSTTPAGCFGFVAEEGSSCINYTSGTQLYRIAIHNYMFPNSHSMNRLPLGITFSYREFI